MYNWIYLQFLTRPNLACSVAKNDCRFFRLWYSTKPFQINIKQEDILKSNLELERTKCMKNCINFIRHHEICRVWDISLWHYPSQCLWVFRWQKVSYSKTFCHLMTVFCKLRKESVSKRKNHYVTSKCNLINFIGGLTRRQESSGIPLKILVFKNCC